MRPSKIEPPGCSVIGSRNPLARISSASAASSAPSNSGKTRGRQVMPLGMARMAKMVCDARFPACQWIAGEPSANDACKCGAATGASRVYCPEHEMRAGGARRSEGEAASSPPASARKGTIKNTRHSPAR